MTDAFQPSANAEDVGTDLLRRVLEAICVKEGISLDSDAEPGTPARNYELAQRLGIGTLFGLLGPAEVDPCRHRNPETGDVCQRDRGHRDVHASWADPARPPYRTWHA